MNIGKSADLVLRIGFLVLIVVFFGLYLRGIDFNSVNDISINWPAFVLASVFGVIFRYWGVLVWKLILIDLGASNLPRFSVLASVYAKAWLGRYIPGTVAWIAGKIYMASKHGISKSRLAVSSLLEGGMQIVSISAVSIFLLVFDTRLDVIPVHIKVILIFIGLLLFFFLSPPIFNRLISKAYRLVKKESSGPELLINRRAVGRSFLLYTIGAFITGSSYFLLSLSIYPEISFNEFFFIVGAFNLAGTIGMATPFVPSGLGVRDGIQLLLLDIIMPAEFALIVTIASRLWSAIVDVVFYLASNGFNKVMLKAHGENA